MSRVYLTGCSGFVGSALLVRLCADLYPSTIAVRTPAFSAPEGVRVEVVPSLSSDGDFQRGLVGQDVVIHCAGRAHVLRDHVPDPLAEFRAVNLCGTLNLARQAAQAGVKRFIFLSSIKVNGELTLPGSAFTAESTPLPTDAYGISKYEAEEQLRGLAQHTGMEVVIIRPVLVYGPGVKANFQTMMRWLLKGVPLPLGAIHNKRSLVALDNLIDLIVTCIDHPAAANQVFLVSDGEDISTSQLLFRMARALGKQPVLFPLPSKLLLLFAEGIGQREFAQRLCSSLQVDISKTRALLGWEPPVSMEAALQQTARDFLEKNT